MIEYPKIQSMYKRDMSQRGNPVVVGDYTTPVFSYLADNTWVWTEKVDGTNIRVHWDGGVVTFGGRTDNAQTPTFLLARLQEIFGGVTGVLKMGEKFGTGFDDTGTPDVTLFGEGFGARIQKGGGNYVQGMGEAAKQAGVDFVMFDVLVRGVEGRSWWLQREAVEEVAFFFGVPVVPVVGMGTLEQATELTRAGWFSTWSRDVPFLSEGLVLRPEVELFDRSGHRVITKIKHKDFS